MVARIRRGAPATDTGAVVDVTGSGIAPLVLLDIGLPEMDGYEVGAAVRKIPEFDDLLLVAMTGYGQEEDRRKSKEVGFDEHLIKPPSIAQMRAVLSHPKLRKFSSSRGATSG